MFRFIATCLHVPVITTADSNFNSRLLFFSFLVEHPSISTDQPKTPTVTVDPVVRVPNGKIPPPQQQLSTAAGTLPAAPSTSQSAEKILVAPFTSPQPASRAVTPVTEKVKDISIAAEGVKTQTSVFTTATSKSTSSSPDTPLSSPTSVTPVTGATPPSVASTSSHSTAPLSTSAAAFHARFGRTVKHATKDSPRIFGVKCVVDFERIYRYLSAIHKPNDECHLTPMGES